MTIPRALRASAPERGAALPLALLVLLLVTVLGLTLVSLGMTEVAIATNWKAYSTAFYAADAGLESGMVGLRSLLAQTPSPSPAQLNLIQPPILTKPKVTFTGFSVGRVLAGPPYRTAFTSGPYGGFSGLVSDYRITAQAVGDGGARANLAQIFRYVQVPLFQFGVFYGNGVDLEIAPGPDMTFNGRVHANSNIYLGAGSTLQFQSYMTTAGKIYRHIKRDTAIPWGNNPQIQDASGVFQPLNFDHDYKPSFGSQWAQTSDWVSKALNTFGGKVQDGAMGVGQITPPIPELFNNPTNPDAVAHQMIELPKAGDSPDLKQAKLYSQAGLRIVDGVATDQNGSSVPLPAGVITSTSFYDMREEKTVNVIQVDVGKLSALGVAPANGVLYVTSTAVPTGTALPAVRLVNGSALPSQGLTVVSQNAIYVQGDYNTALTGAGGNHPPAAVLADAITVLSNNWGTNKSDTKGNQATNNRPASTTTVNAAFATGPSAESTPGQGNGQLENDVRFLENWTGQTLTYKGSLVNLWHSQQATGAWRCCGSGGTLYYSPPARNWGYDALFDTTPPPGTPSGVIMLRGPWSQG